MCVCVCARAFIKILMNSQLNDDRTVSDRSNGRSVGLLSRNEEREREKEGERGGFVWG